MKSRERSQNFKSKADSQSDGSIWELCLFAIFFVIVFSAVARAEAAPVNAKRSGSVRVVNARNVSARAAKVRSFNARSAKSSARTLVRPSAQVAQNDTQTPPPSTAPLSPAEAAAANPGANPVRARQEQLSPIPTNAMPDSNLRAALPEPKLKAARFAPSGRFTLETTSTVSPDSPRSFGGWYLLSLGLQDTESNVTLGLRAGYAREYSYQRDDGSDGDFDNPTVSLFKTWKNGDDFTSPVFDTISIGVAGLIAANRDSRRRTFLGSIGPSFTVSKAIRKLTIGLGGGYSRNFYGFDIQDNGTVNAPDQFRGTAELSYSVTDKFTLSAALIHMYAVSFQNVGKATEITSLSGDYAFLKNFGVSLGVATLRGTLEADGYTNNVKLFDANVAQAFLDLNFSF